MLLVRKLYHVLIETAIFCGLMGQAQRLLEEVSRQAEVHAALQCKQRDEQKKIIKKHEVILSSHFPYNP